MGRPLAWLILLEVVVVAALGATTYHVVSGRSNQPLPLPPIAAPPAPRKAPPAPTPTTAALAPTPKPTGPAPGLSLDPLFWTGQLQRINRDQHDLARLQWQVTQAVTDWIRAYVNHVLVPAVKEAEKT